MIKDKYIPFEPSIVPELDLNKLINVRSTHFHYLQNELKNNLNGRSILLLMELAIQGPKKSNLKFISNILNIPPSTMAKEIRKLMNLDYIKQNFYSEKFLDNRFKFYSLTKKGISFLQLMSCFLCLTNIHLNNIF